MPQTLQILSNVYILIITLKSLKVEQMVANITEVKTDGTTTVKFQTRHCYNSKGKMMNKHTTLFGQINEEFHIWISNVNFEYIFKMCQMVGGNNTLCEVIASDGE